MREIGPINPAEVRRFQVAQGLHVDGKVGRQTWGRVLELQQRLASPPPPEPVAVRRFHWTEWALAGFGVAAIVAAIVVG